MVAVIAKFISPRVRRLAQDHERLRARFANWPFIRLTGTAGLPPGVLPPHLFAARAIRRSWPERFSSEANTSSKSISRSATRGARRNAAC